MAATESTMGPFQPQTILFMFLGCSSITASMHGWQGVLAAVEELFMSPKGNRRRYILCLHQGHIICVPLIWLLVLVASTSTIRCCCCAPVVAGPTSHLPCGWQRLNPKVLLGQQLTVTPTCLESNQTSICVRKHTLASNSHSFLTG